MDIVVVLYYKTDKIIVGEKIYTFAIPGSIYHALSEVSVLSCLFFWEKA